ncbi:hypothetical protein PHMEG_00039052 [Phytophthora megakarya]|uniref:Uncharacterized protein n=1 Tax=Phytophthora megakarya TaxID=4795 RepID=A0A225UGE2_9STRA|nr:hypothetical protein PHMEG_00039052 [Phytophthora megakarya]
MDKFKSLKLDQQSVNNDILALQNTSTPVGYDNVLMAITEKHPNGVSKIVAEEIVEDHVWRQSRRNSR